MHKFAEMLENIINEREFGQFTLTECITYSTGSVDLYEQQSYFHPILKQWKETITIPTRVIRMGNSVIVYGADDNKININLDVEEVDYEVLVSFLSPFNSRVVLPFISTSKNTILVGNFAYSSHTELADVNIVGGIEFKPEHKLFELLSPKLELSISLDTFLGFHYRLYGIYDLEIESSVTFSAFGESLVFPITPHAIQSIDDRQYKKILIEIILRNPAIGRELSENLLFSSDKEAFENRILEYIYD